MRVHFSPSDLLSNQSTDFLKMIVAAVAADTKRTIAGDHHRMRGNGTARG